MSLTVIKGDDATLVSQTVRSVVKELVGSGDRSLMVEEVTEANYVPDGGSPELTALVNAAHTPPFLTERRVVVGRHLALFTKGEQVAGLVEWIASPLPSTDLVLVWEKAAGSGARMGAMPKALKEAVKKAGGREIDAAPSGRGRKMLVDEKLADAPLRLDVSARKAISGHFGDEAGRVDALLETLVSGFGEGARLTLADVEPFLGQASDVPPWDLTDAIDGGRIEAALDMLHRMLGSDRHALQVLATLHGHYQRVLALDGSGVADEKAAAARLGMTGSTFPAKKALALGRKLGPERTHRAVELLARADLDVRGESATPPNTVLEVLVARLAHLSR